MREGAGGGSEGRKERREGLRKREKGKRGERRKEREKRKEKGRGRRGGQRRRGEGEGGRRVQEMWWGGEKKDNPKFCTLSLNYL